MLKNYLTVALRNMKRQRVYANINVLGLTIALVCAILIITFVRYELSYETGISNIDRVYRVVQRQPGNVFLGSDQFAVTMAPLANALETEVPGVEAATAFDNRSGLLSAGDDHFYEEGLVADAHFFSVFDYAFEAGAAESALSNSTSMVITRSLAKRMFGEEDAIGQLVEMDNGFGTVQEFQVTGIVSDPPENSHIQFSFIGSILGNSNYQNNLDRWNNSSWYTYFRIQENQDPNQVAAQIAALPAKYYPDRAAEERREFPVQSALSIHLHSNVNFDFTQGGDINFIYLLSAIGLVVLLLACVNYVNLAIAHSLRRSKEVGVRKVVGAARRQLVWQFLSQSILTSAMAVVISLGLIWIFLPRFSAFVERDLPFFSQGFFGLAGLLTALVIVVGFIGGWYPALVASRMKPARILKGNASTGKGGSGLRRILVTTQFVVSVTLIAATLIIFGQMKYIDSKELGFRKDHVMTVSLQDRHLRERFSEVEALITGHPDILSASLSNHLPTRISSNTTISEWTDRAEDEDLEIYQTSIGYDFLDIYEIPVVLGRGFSPDFPADDSLRAYVINETAYAALGWTDLAGKTIRERPVVGVVKDFHMHSLRLEIMPLMMRLDPDSGWQLSIKVTNANPFGAARFVEETLAEMSEYPIEVRFVEDVYSALYEDDSVLSQAMGLFTLLAIFIGGMGLFGLVAYSAESRTKEIGVRKVMGASVPSILRLFASEYAAMIVVAGLIGVPLAFVVMSRWLDQFVYRIELSPVHFALSIGLLVVIAALSMIYQTTRAATQDSVHALRYE